MRIGGASRIELHHGGLIRRSERPGSAIRMPQSPTPARCCGQRADRGAPACAGSSRDGLRSAAVTLVRSLSLRGPMAMAAKPTAASRRAGSHQSGMRKAANDHGPLIGDPRSAVRHRRAARLAAAPAAR